MKAILNFLRHEDGPTAVEYAVMLAMIIVAAMIAISFFGEATNGSFTRTGTAITTAVGS